MKTDYPKKIKLQTWREKKYMKTTNEMGSWFPGGRNMTKSLSLIVVDDDDDDDDEIVILEFHLWGYFKFKEHIE